MHQHLCNESPGFMQDHAIDGGLLADVPNTLHLSVYTNGLWTNWTHQLDCSHTRFSLGYFRAALGLHAASNCMHHVLVQILKKA